MRFVWDSREQWFPVEVGESLDAASPGGRRPVLPETHLDFPASMKQPNLPVAGYHRTVDGGGLTWTQYWFWYLYNVSLGGITGNHEGDWEFVQIGRDGSKAILVTGSRHRGGEARYRWDWNGTIYLALGSHAAFFARGDALEYGDVCDGNGRALDANGIEWRDFGSWASWPGRWGNSTGAGRSPESPGCQGDRWTRPHVFHSLSRCRGGER